MSRELVKLVCSVCGKPLRYSIKKKALVCETKDCEKEGQAGEHVHDGEK